MREVLLEAERAGFVEPSGRGGQLVQLTPSVMQVFDRFIADSMSGHDLMFQIALKTMTASKRRHGKSPRRRTDAVARSRPGEAADSIEREN